MASKSPLSQVKKKYFFECSHRNGQKDARACCGSAFLCTPGKVKIFLMKEREPETFIEISINISIEPGG